MGLAGLVAGLCALHFWWLVRFRRDFAVDVDEAGYLWFAFRLHDEIEADGLLGVWHGIQGHGWVGPLLPALTAVLEVPIAGTRIIPAMAVQLPLFALLVFASYGIGRRLLDARAGLVTAVVVAAIPAVTDFVRTYHLVIASTATYALATYALLASDRLRRRGLVLAWGVALGLLLLSRGMTIAFLPALPVAGLWILVVDRADRERFANFGLGLAALTGTALLWYASSWRPLFDYLVGFGYGDESPAREPKLSLLSLDFWTDELSGMLDLVLYLPLAIVIAAAFVLAVASSTGRPRLSGASRRFRRSLGGAAKSDAVVPTFVVVEGYLALSSTSNDGTGFAVPLLPSLIALAVLAVWRVRWSRVRVALAAAMLAASAFNVVMKADVVAGASHERRVTLPVVGRATVTNGRGFFQERLIEDAGYALESPTSVLPDKERGWLRLWDAVVASSDRPEGAPEPRLYLSTSEPLLNPSAIRLASIRQGRSGGIFELVDTRGDDTVPAYRRFLAEAHPDILVTVSRQSWAFTLPITQRRVETAAVALGFAPIRRLTAPDGRRVRVWISPR